MEFYVLEAVKIKNQNTAVAVTIKTDEKEAKMVFHQILATAYANPDLENGVVEIINSYGGRVDVENWAAPVEPEPEI